MSWSSTEIHITCLTLVGWVLRAISEISQNIIKKDSWKMIIRDCFAQIEWVINGRPLAYLSEDHLGDALTPDHLMFGRKIRIKSNAVVPESIVQDFSKRYKYISKLVNDQWKRFSKVHLTELWQHHINRKEKH